MLEEDPMSASAAAAALAGAAALAALQAAALEGGEDPVSTSGSDNLKDDKEEDLLTLEVKSRKTVGCAKDAEISDVMAKGFLHYALQALESCTTTEDEAVFGGIEQAVFEMILRGTNWGLPSCQRLRSVTNKHRMDMARAVDALFL